MARESLSRRPPGGQGLRLNLHRCLLVVLGAVALTVVGTAPAGQAAEGGAGGASTTTTLGDALRPSTAEQSALSDHLRSIGAVFYGAWWCPACFKQKNLFGQEAGRRLPYVECDMTDSGRERCKDADIRAYPTWILGEQRIEGVQTIDELKRWSGFPADSVAP